MSWQDYAALTRQLGDLRRAAAADTSTAERQRASARDRVSQVDQRLADQRDRLQQLARLIGAAPRDLDAPVRPAGGAPPQPPLTATAWTPDDARAIPGGPGGTPLPPGPHPQALTGYPHGAGSPDGAGFPQDTGSWHGTGSPPGTAPYPSDPRIPAQRTGPPPVPAPAPANAAERPPGDPMTALATAEWHADVADEAASRAEAQASRPALLPGASALTRSLAVYGACAAVVLFLQVAMVLGSDSLSGMAWSVGAWMCTGLPALAFFTGFAALTFWGKPRIHDGSPVDRYPRVGFAICFLALPAVGCAYIVVKDLLFG